MSRPLAPDVAWRTVVGLEVHCQLGTQSKLFCGCAAQHGAPPNSRVCPVCSGAPGALPIPNREAVRLALRAGLALGCEIERASRFDRKHYFYCDLPKGYQVTQLERPLASGGGLELGSGKRARLRRIHVEEDAGKAIHDRGAHTLVDLNRAGVPLIEIVGEADLDGAAEAQEYLALLRETLRFAGVSECDMEKGSLRCDVNVSVHRPGEPLGTRVEIKNLNSFKAVGAAIEHEAARQVRTLEGGARVAQETRAWEAERGDSRPLRSKEDADDYRYFPDPDLPPLALSAAEVERERASLPEPPAALRARWRREHGLSQQEALVLSASPALAGFFEEAARLSGAPREAAGWIANDVSALLARAGAESPAAAGIAPARLAELIGLVARGALSRAGGRAVLELLPSRAEPLERLVAELGLAQVSDAREIEAWAREALAANARAAADVRAGEEKALGALIGRVMKASGGRANPALAREALLRLIAEGA